MKEKEKRIIIYLLLFLIIEITIYLFLIPGLKNSLLSQFDTYNYLRKSLIEAKGKNSRLKEELTKWEEVKKELFVIEKDYLFPNSIEEIRLLIKKLSLNSGVSIGDINYSYEDILENISRIKIDFSLVAPYDSLRRFIGEIEKEPRFVVLKSISLVSTSSDSINAKVSIYIYTKRKE
jgi:Tfp pilus assembly protein PilO